MLIGKQIGQVRSTCHCLRKSNNSSVFSGKNAGKFHMLNWCTNFHSVVCKIIKGSTCLIDFRDPLLLNIKIAYSPIKSLYHSQTIFNSIYADERTSYANLQFILLIFTSKTFLTIIRFIYIHFPQKQHKHFPHLEYCIVNM